MLISTPTFLLAQDKCWDNISVRLLVLPSKSFPIHHHAICRYTVQLLSASLSNSHSVLNYDGQVLSGIC
jgi:hypothetical protein